jgi:hypothetical protein
MARKPVDTAHINLRIRESLRRKLELEADKHQTSLNNEIRVRLEVSLDRQDRIALDDLRQSMEITWLRYGDRFLRLALEVDLIQAMTKSSDPEVAKAARVLVLTAESTRRRAEGLRREQEK